MFKAEFRGRLHKLAQELAGRIKVEGTVATKRRVIELVWEELVTTDRPSIRHDLPSTVIIAGVILPRERDVVELDEFLRTFQVKMAVQKANTQFSLELILFNHGLVEIVVEVHAILADKALLGRVKIGKGNKCVSAVWLQYGRHCG